MRRVKGTRRRCRRGGRLCRQWKGVRESDRDAAEQNVAGLTKRVSADGAVRRRWTCRRRDP